MVQKAAQNNGRRKRKGGPATVEGRQYQIASRLQHGIRSRTPVLLHVESEAEWRDHLDGIRRSFAPGDEYEECLVHLIAYELWRWIGRLIPYERDLTFTRMTAPSDSLIGGGCSSDDIQKVLSTPSANLEAQQRAAREQQARYEALGNGEAGELRSNAAEVEELVGWFRKQFESQLQGEDEDETDEDVENDGAEEQDGPLDQAPIFDGENRSWSGAEVQEQLRLLCEAAGQDWRAKLPWVLYDYQHKLEERFSRLSEATLEELVKQARAAGRTGPLVVGPPRSSLKQDFWRVDASLLEQEFPQGFGPPAKAHSPEVPGEVVSTGLRASLPSESLQDPRRTP